MLSLLSIKMINPRNIKIMYGSIHFKIILEYFIWTKIKQSAAEIVWWLIGVIAKIYILNWSGV